MKTLIAILMLVSSVAFAFDPEPLPQPPVPTPNQQLEGTWIIADRICSSGYPPRDGFEMGRDQMSMEFSHDRYSARLQVQGCTYWVDGKYNVVADIVDFYNVTGASNCGTYRPAPRQSAHFTVKNNYLTFLAGPVSGPGGVCPMGDTLETVFRKHQ